MVNLSIRIATENDIPGMISFFKKAYGPSTAFQSVDFLRYYFRDPWDKNLILHSNWLGFNGDGEIVSHYGGLAYKLILNGKVIDLVWGVNAYTLPEYRGHGYNSNLVKLLFKTNVVNATLGMSLDTHKFYKKLGYQVFDHLRLSRYIFNFKEDSFLIIAKMGQDENLAKKLAPVKSVHDFKGLVEDYHPIDKKIARNSVFNLGSHSKCTTFRDKDFICWRFLENPFIDYQFFVEIIGGEIKAYAAIRVEQLLPFGKFVTRIVDLFGEPSSIVSVIGKVKTWSFFNGHLYIDYSKIGQLYTSELLDHGFSELKEDDVALFPQVSSPVENRLNQEYLGIHSVPYNDEILGLSSDDVYFTRADSDRDRLVKINQIFEANEK